MLITIFTPTYNRAHLLPRLYESLCKQTFKDFEWVIVDDGSVDETRNVVAGFEDDNEKIPIRYFYKKNGGKHRAINRGVREAQGELFFIADSDDWLPENALAFVSEEYEKVKANRNIAGVAGLDCYADGSIVGSGLPKDVLDCNAINIRMKYYVKGDMKEVFFTSVLNEFPFPEIEGEKFCPEQLVWFRIALKYDLHYFNKPIYIAEYQDSGITSGITNARMNSPIASMMTYAELNSYDIPFVSKIKAAINYWRFRFCSNAAEKPSLAWWWGWTAPIGYMMHLNDVRK